MLIAFRTISKRIKCFQILTFFFSLRCTEQFTFTPFGHGARQCPGRRVAEQEMDLLFRAILKSYKVEYNHGEMGTKVRLFNKADKPAQFSFVPL